MGYHIGDGKNLDFGYILKVELRVFPKIQNVSESISGMSLRFLALFGRKIKLLGKIVGRVNLW